MVENLWIAGSVLNNHRVRKCVFLGWGVVYIKQARQLPKKHTDIMNIPMQFVKLFLHNLKSKFGVQ